MNEAEKLQGKLLKAAVGLKRYCRKTPLLKTLKIQDIQTTVNIHELVLFRNMFISSARCSNFYQFLLGQHLKGTSPGSKSLISRVIKTCQSYNISLVKLICEQNYVDHVKRALSVQCPDGLVDTVQFIMYNPGSFVNPRNALNLLLSPC